MSTYQATYLEDLFAPFGPVAVKRMFGGLGVFHQGLMMALVADDRLYVKVDDTTQPRFANAGGAPFVYGGKGKPMEMSYWIVPDSALDDPHDFKEWADLAWAAALRADAAKPPAKRKHRPIG